METSVCASTLKQITLKIKSQIRHFAVHWRPDKSLQRTRPGDLLFPEGRHKLRGDHRLLSFECQPEEQAARLAAVNNATVSQWGSSPQCWAHQSWGRCLLASSCSAYNQARLVLLWKKMTPVTVWTGSGETGILISTILINVWGIQIMCACVCASVWVCVWVWVTGRLLWAMMSSHSVSTATV